MYECVAVDDDQEVLVPIGLAECDLGESDGLLACGHGLIAVKRDEITAVRIPVDEAVEAVVPACDKIGDRRVQTGLVARPKNIRS